MKKKKNKGLIIFIIALAVIIIGATVVKVVTSDDTAITSNNGGVVVERVEEHELSTTINATGTVASQNVYSVTTDATSKCTQLNVSLGDEVKAGDVLCVFDDTDLKEQIEELEEQLSVSEKLTAKNMEIAQRNLDEAKASQTSTLSSISEKYTAANNTYQAALDTYNAMADTDPNKQTYYNDIVVPARTAVNELYDTYNETVKTTNSAIQSAQDNIETMNIENSAENSGASNLAKLYKQLDKLTVVAEQSGIITSLNIKVGGYASGAIMQIEDSDNLQITVSIKEADILKLKEGMSALITANAIPDEEYTGKVGRVINFASTVTDLSGTKSSSGYSADILVDKGSSLLLGMSTKVVIALTDAKTVLSVAYDAIGEDADGNYVYKAVDNGDGTYTATKVSVTKGSDGDYYTEIISDNIAKGDLIVSYPGEVTDGQVIEIMDGGLTFEEE